jgi:hypothetical protein
MAEARGEGRSRNDTDVFYLPLLTRRRHPRRRDRPLFPRLDGVGIEARPMDGLLHAKEAIWDGTLERFSLGTRLCIPWS